MSVTASNETVHFQCTTAVRLAPKGNAGPPKRKAATSTSPTHRSKVLRVRRLKASADHAAPFRAALEVKLPCQNGVSLPCQDGVRSPTSSRVFSGPWCGPFAAHPEAAASGPLYLDEDGTLHESLDIPPTASPLDASPPQSPPMINTFISVREQPRNSHINMQLVAVASKALEVATARYAKHGEDAAAARRAKACLQGIKPAQWALARGARARRTMQTVMQPRRNNC
ncbi:hypothetical protein V8C86DRAFT_2820777 [Haematococcus lacustris]